MFRTAKQIISGVEVMHMLKKGQLFMLNLNPSILSWMEMDVWAGF
jgi:hypothetical protein